MLNSEPAKKVVVYVGEDHKYHGQAAFIAILEYLVQKRVRQASATRGVAGFGADHHLHTITIECLAVNLPVRIEFLESSTKVDELMPALCEMAGTGIVEVQETALSVTPSGDSSKREGPVAERKRAAKAQLMRIFIGENEQWGGKPLYQALVESMRANDISGVTVYQGAQGYRENGEIDRDYIHLASRDRPISITVVETEDKIRAFLPLFERMAQGGLVALSEVETIRYTHDFYSSERRSKLR
jgi:PII-like signaling protein